MGSGSASGRVVAALCLAVHLLVAGVAPAADARLEAASYADTELHVESETAVPCALRHDHLRCQLCRALDRPFAVGLRIVAAAREQEVAARPAIAHESPRGPAPHPGLNARAPPRPLPPV